MDLRVKIAKVLEPYSYVSKKDGLTYTKHSFLGVTDGQYAKTICFSVFGDDKYNGFGVQVGGEYDVSFDVSSREYNGRWYTQCDVWKMVRVDGVSTPQEQTQTMSKSEQANALYQGVSATSGASDEKLPF